MKGGGLLRSGFQEKRKFVTAFWACYRYLRPGLLPLD